MIAAANPTTIEMRAPKRSCESTSDPLSVVPSQCSELGGARVSRLEAYGSSGAIALPKMAMKMKRPSTARPKRPRQVPKSSSRALAPRHRACTRGSRKK